MFQHGLYTALVTPFTQGRGLSLDTNSFQKLLDRQIEAEVSGLVLFGSTGESPTVTLEERERMLSIAMERASSKMTIMAGISTNDLQIALALAQQAKRLHVHGLQIATPSYNKPTQEGIYQYFKAIGEAVDVPIFVYNIPGRSSVHIDKATMRRLFALPFIGGMKESSGSLGTLLDFLEASQSVNRPLLLLEGDDVLTLPAIASGAHGTMSVLSNLLPHTMKALVDAALKNDIAKARDLFFAIKPLIEACFYETNPTPIKYLLYQKGLLENPSVRLPLVEPSPSVKESLQNMLSLFQTWK